jgi:hypothetical protein
MAKAAACREEEMLSEMDFDTLQDEAAIPQGLKIAEHWIQQQYLTSSPGPILEICGGKGNVTKMSVLHLWLLHHKQESGVSIRTSTLLSSLMGD